MPSESLSVRLSGINSASNAIDGGKGYNFFTFFSIKYKYFDQSLVCVTYYIQMIHENTLLKSGFLQLGHIAPWGHRILVRAYEMIVRATIMNKGSISVVLK